MAHPTETFRARYRAAVGLQDDAYSPASRLAMDEWPSLQSLIDAGTRLVTFMDYHADASRVPYILDQFAYMFETPFDTTDITFPQCALDRPAGASPEGRMYLVNHYLDIDLFGILVPNQAAAPITNSDETSSQTTRGLNSEYMHMAS